MSEKTDPLRVLILVGNRAKESTTRIVLERCAALLNKAGAGVDTFDCAHEELPLFDVQTSYSNENYSALKTRVARADVLVIGTPDYHGSMSGATKNFLDHFWKEYAGKLFVSIVGSFEKGLTVHDQIRTVARQCYAWSLPYGVSFHEKSNFNEGQEIGETLEKRLRMMSADTLRYGRLLADQKRADLASTEDGFLAHYRS
jgi:NAD(P)H-dependent FMN reductase